SCSKKDLYRTFRGRIYPPSSAITLLNEEIPFVLVEYSFTNWLWHAKHEFPIEGDFAEIWKTFVGKYGLPALSSAYILHVTWIFEAILVWSEDGTALLTESDKTECYPDEFLVDAVNGIEYADMVEIILKFTADIESHRFRDVLLEAVHSLQFVKLFAERMNSVYPFIDEWRADFNSVKFPMNVSLFLEDELRKQDFDLVRSRVKMNPLFVRAWNNALDETTDFTPESIFMQNNLDKDRNILHTCCARGHIDAVKKLLQQIGSTTAITSSNSDDGKSISSSSSVSLDENPPTAINFVDSNGWSPLHIASHAGNASLVQLLLDNGARIEATTEQKWTALHFAAFDGHSEVVETLLQHGAIPDTLDLSAYSPVYYAIEQNHSSIAELLISKIVSLSKNEGHLLFAVNASKGNTKLAQILLSMGVSVDGSGNGLKNPLHIAASEGHLEFVKFLLKNGANVEEKTNKRTPLHFACQFRHFPCCKVLLEHGADPNAKDMDNKTAMHYSVQMGNSPIISLLLRYGALLDIPTFGDGFTPLHYSMKNRAISEQLLNAGAPINAADTRGRTFLHYAASAGEKETIDLIFSRQDAQVDSRDQLGYTPLMLAVNGNHKESVIRLLAKGADVNARNEKLMYPLLFVTTDKQLEVAEILIKAGSLVNEASKDGMVPILQAQSVEFAKLLVDAGADLKAKDKNGENCLHKSIDQSEQLTEYLIEAGADLEAIEDDFGSTPLCAATIGRYGILKVETIQVLLKHGANCNAVDKEGFTALHGICKQTGDHVQVAQMLVDKGADILVTRNGWNPILFAILKNNLKIVELLFSKWPLEKNVDEPDTLWGDVLCSACYQEPKVGQQVYRCTTCAVLKRSSGTGVIFGQECVRRHESSYWKHDCVEMEHPCVTLQKMIEAKRAEGK
ncbi:UNVERIFIED_CONTAM: Carrier protein, mitochondrial, partial [Siphonaria sp. JEL0065]